MHQNVAHSIQKMLRRSAEDRKFRQKYLTCVWAAQPLVQIGKKGG
jgi:hypothetical protein